MKISIKDIAKHCGMSVSTVSRALNDDYGVKPKTRTLVLDAAKELGYVPNLAAKELVSQKSKLVGILITDNVYEARPAFFELLQHINKALALHHYRSIICTVNDVNYVKGELSETIASRNLNGCIIMNPFPSHHPIYEEIEGMDSPTVVLEQSIVTRTCSNLNTDEVLGAYMATRWLIEHGHRRIALVNGTEAYEISRQRLEGFLQAADEAGLPPDDRPVVWSDYTGSGGQEAVHRLLRLHPETTAVFFANDLMAMGAISSLAEAGIHVPGQLSVIGYDGLYVGKYYNPPLASIVIDNPAIGTKAAELLLELIHGGTGRSVRIKPHLFQGKSTAARTY
ncbi:LacI family DNA-binding transcriptional regulator [Paenibacillus kobensis]|uniref:LacI family DNA-binding transcriptional regulator n=1 Tax=Paenibacillus kobensis TaxID=59841 RepID=UPI0013E3D233|nr:LacI family DNA-binding transcriptional regulator [Paenibacillus kobensis]